MDGRGHGGSEGVAGSNHGANIYATVRRRIGADRGAWDLQILPTMRISLLGPALAAALAAACGPRQVEIRTAADLPPQAAIVVENTLGQALNVYVVDGGNELFLRQVASGATVRLPVRGIPNGRSVTLRATTRDGARTYSREGVLLGGTYSWRVP